MTNTEQAVIVYVCGTCSNPYHSFSGFSAHLDGCGDYETVSDAVRDCDAIREVSTDGGQDVGVTAHHPSDESPKLMYCHRCVGDTLHSWNNGLWVCESCGRYH